MATNMIIIVQLLLLLVYLISLYILIKLRSEGSLLTDWPVLGMTPCLLKNAHRIHDFVTHLLQQSCGTFEFKGPSLANIDLLFTSDPINIHYILSKNFNNYPKGPEFRKIFDILGDGIFNVDAHLWEVHRRTTMSLFNHADFCKMLQEIIWKKVEKGLIPVLDYVSKQGIEVDLQEIFQRFSFDNVCSLILDHDPESLSVDLPYIPCEKAFTFTEEALLYRHLLPERVWKLQSWIGIGKEKGLTKAWEAFDHFIYPCIYRKREELLNRNSEHLSEADKEDKQELLKTYMELAYNGKTRNPEKFLRDTCLNLMVAGRDTTSAALSWFFWLLLENPLVESKIQEEIETKLHPTEDESQKLFNMEDLRKLVYLHGALCEALRLFPPVGLEHKAPIQPDILPSGHLVDKDSKIVLSFYSMGRMESIWGKDCLEFKPERWINERGGIKHEPSYKFPAFNAGPRTCLGKEMAFMQMKIVAINIIRNYRIKVVEGHPVVPGDSIILQMKYGLKVRLAKRSA